MDQRRSDDSSVKEPIRSPWVWVIMTVIIVAGIPLYLPAGTVEPLVFGIPYWLVLSVLFTLALSAFTCWLCLRRWHLVEQQEEAGVDIKDGGPTWKI